MPWIDLTPTDDTAIHDDVAGEINALTTVTPADTDVLVIEDASDSFNKKKILVSSIGTGGGSGSGCTELLMQDGVTAPPVPIETEARDDWLYEECTAGSGTSSTPSLAVVHYTGANDQAIPTATHTAIEFATELYDSDGYWSVGNPTRLTVPTNGVYRLTGSTRMDGETTFDTSTGNFRALRFRVNGSADNSDWYGEDFRRAISGSDPGHAAEAVIVLDAGDYVELMMFQNSGETLNIPGDATLLARFSIERIVDLT